MQLCRSLSHVIKDYLHQAIHQLQEGQEYIHSELLLIDSSIAKLSHASEIMTAGQKEKHQGRSRTRRLITQEHANLAM